MKKNLLGTKLYYRKVRTYNNYSQTFLSHVYAKFIGAHYFKSGVKPVGNRLWSNIADWKLWELVLLVAVYYRSGLKYRWLFMVPGCQLGFNFIISMKRWCVPADGIYLHCSWPCNNELYRLPDKVAFVTWPLVTGWAPLVVSAHTLGAYCHGGWRSAPWRGGVLWDCASLALSFY